MDETLGKLVLQALQERLGGRKLLCGFCGGTRYQVSGIVKIPVQDKLNNTMVIGGKTLPLAAITCEICGNTNFLNIIRLVGKEKFNEMVAQQQTVQEVEQFLNKGGKGEEGKT